MFQEDDWVDVAPSAKSRKGVKVASPVDDGWVDVSPEQVSGGPPKTQIIPPSQPGVEINLSDFSRAKNLLPSQQEVSRRVYQSLGFTDEEAQKYSGESGKSFYEGNPADLLKISETDPATLGRVVLPELTPGAIQEKRDWLSNHREQKAAQEAEMSRQGANLALSMAAGFHVPQFASEAFYDMSAGALGSVGAATKGAGTLAEKLRRGLGYQEQNSALTRWGEEIQGTSKTLAQGGAPEGSTRKTLQYGAGAVIPALALRHPEAIGGLSALEAKGEGKSDWEAVKSGLISAAMVGAMGKAAQGVNRIEGLQNVAGESLADRAQKVLGRFSGRAVANIGIGEGGVIVQGGFNNPQAQAQNLTFGTGFATFPHPGPEHPFTPKDPAIEAATPLPPIRSEEFPYTPPIQIEGPTTIPSPVRSIERPLPTDVNAAGSGFLIQEPGKAPRFSEVQPSQGNVSKPLMGIGRAEAPQEPYARPFSQRTRLMDGGVAERVESGNPNVPPVLSRMTSGLFGVREQRVGPEATLPTPDKGTETSPTQPPPSSRELTDAELKSANDKRSEGMTAIGPEDVGVPKGGGEFPPEQKFGAKTSIPNQELNEGGIPTISPKLPSAEELSNFKSPIVKEAVSRLEKPNLGARIAEGLAGNKGRGTQELLKEPEDMTLQELQDVVKRPQDYSRKAFEDASTEWKYRKFSGQEGFLGLGRTDSQSQFEKEMAEKYGEKWFRKMSPEEALKYRDSLSVGSDEYIISKAKNEAGNIYVGINAKRMTQMMARNLYSGDIGAVATRELVQNAVDAIRPMEGKGHIKITVPKDSSQGKFVTVEDSGVGMSPETVEKQFIDLGDSLKSSGESNTGGFGVGLASAYANAEHFALETVWKSPDGNLVRTQMSGSAEDLLDPDKGLTPETKLVGKEETEPSTRFEAREDYGKWEVLDNEGSKDVYGLTEEAATQRAIELNRQHGKPVSTGTKVHIEFNADSKYDDYQIKDLLEKLHKHSNLPGTLEIKSRSMEEGKVNEREPWYLDRKTNPQPVLDTIDSGAGRMEIRSSAGSPERETSYVRLHLLNNGLYQGSTETYLGSPLKVSPELTVDVKSGLLPEHPNYPWELSREGLRGTAKESLDKWIQTKLKDAASAKMRGEYLAAVNDSPTIAGTNFGLIESSSRIPKSVLEGLASRPSTTKVAEAAKTVYDNLVRLIGREDYKGTQFRGLGLNEDWYGVSILHPESFGKDTLVYLNPFAIVDSTNARARSGEITQHQAIDAAAARMVAILIHEATHTPVRGHGDEFSSELTNNIGLLLEWMQELHAPMKVALQEGNTYDELQQTWGEAKQHFSEQKRDVLGSIGVQSRIKDAGRGSTEGDIGARESGRLERPTVDGPSSERSRVAGGRLKTVGERLMGGMFGEGNWGDERHVGGGGPKIEFESRMEKKYGIGWLRKMSPEEVINYRDAIANQSSPSKNLEEAGPKEFALIKEHDAALDRLRAVETEFASENPAELEEQKSRLDAARADFARASEKVGRRFEEMGLGPEDDRGDEIFRQARAWNSAQKGSINLNLLGVPQASKVIQAGQDLLKRIPDLTSVKGARGVWNNLKWLVGSDSMLDPKTKLVAREWMGWRALDDARAYQAVKDLNKHFTSGIQLDSKSYTPEVQSRLQSGVINPKQAYFIDFEDRIQRGIPQANPQLQGFADTVKSLFNERLDTIKNEKLGGKEILDAYYNNYFPQLFKNSDKAQTFVQEFLSRTPLAGNAGGAFKAKKYPTILDGLDAGLELKFQNPAESVLTRIGQLDHFIMGHRIGEEVKNNPQLGGQWLPPTAQLPEGYSWVNDKIFTQFAPPNRRGGISIAKRFAAPTPIANVIDRVVAPSFFNNSAARGLRDINNLMLSVKLGLSSFHGFFAAQDAPAFKLAQVLEKLSKSDFAGAVQSLKELPAAPVSLYSQGSMLAKEALNPGSTGSAQHAQMVDWLTAGGARFNQTADYSSNFADKLSQGMRETAGSFRNGEYLDALTKVPGIASRSPLALIEQVGKPIMKYEVPNIKLGVKAQLMQTEMDRLGSGATREQIRAASARVNDVVDDALGQLAYDNLFWHPALKGMAQLGVQSMGWSLGTARSVGGGMLDLVKQPVRLGAKGVEKVMEQNTPTPVSKVAAQPIELTHRAAYVMGMTMMTALTNTIIQGVLTKINKGAAEAPKDWKDLFIPRTGRVDDQGREERVTNPSYVKDILHFSSEPLATAGNKASPLLRTFYEQLRNADWRHVEIVPNGQEYNPLSGDFWKGRSSHFLQQFTPISVNNLLKERAANDEEQKFPWPPFPTSKEEALPFLGVTKAPAALTDTPAELYISHTLAGQKAQRPMTEGEFERSALKNRLAKGLREGTDTASDQLTKGLDEGVINTRDLSFVFGNALTHTKLERNFGALERFENAVKAYNLASEKEKELIRPILIKKYVGESEKWAASPAKTKEIDGLAQQAGLR